MVRGVSRVNNGEGPSIRRNPKRQRANGQAQANLGEEITNNRDGGGREGDNVNSGNGESADARNGRPSENGSITVNLTDPAILDCSICYEPLIVPVYQCKNGHIACSNCCTKAKKKCPFCCLVIGDIRCRAIERVIESVKVNCSNEKYGCKELVYHNRKLDHEKECLFVPCTCPLLNCDFISSDVQLGVHFRNRHPNSAISFQYDKVFTLGFSAGKKFIVLQEKSLDLFILTCCTNIFGKIVSVSRITPPGKKELLFDIGATSQDGGVHRLQGRAKNIQKHDEPYLHSSKIFLVPDHFFSSEGMIKLGVTIYLRRKPKDISLT